MATQPARRVKLQAKVMKDGRVNLDYGGNRLAFILPEIFTEGWAKHTPMASPKAKGHQGLVILPAGSIGLKTTATPVKGGFLINAILTPFSTVKVIHIRQVVNLPYGDWAGKGFRLGKQRGQIPVNPEADNKISEGDMANLELGPHPGLKGKSLKLKASRLHLVLQDNRQWSPFLHAFVTRNEPSDSAWSWKKGVKKEFRMTLTIE